MRKRIIILCCFIFHFLLSFGQSKYYDYNRSQIESLKKVFDTICRDYNSERPVSKRMIKWDRQMIPFLNAVYNKNLTLSEIQSAYEKITPKELSFDFSDTKDLGGFKRYESPIYSEGNLRINLLLVVVDDIILHKKFYFETKRYTSCFNPPIWGISEYDLKYLEEHCLKLIDFPISIKKWPYISAEKTFFENLSLLSAKGFRGFDSDSSRQLNDLIFYEYTLYDFNNVLSFVRDLYENNRTDSLIELLYAPNYAVAIDAMEALVALNKIKKIPLSSKVLNKMDAIKNSDIKISWQFSDVHYHEMKTYKELNLSEERILKKFENIQ